MLKAIMLLNCTTLCCAHNTAALNGLVEFYSEHLRGNLFSGFLALGGFLFSMKTFIVVKMKEGVYDTPEHETTIKNGRRSFPTMKYYGSLGTLSLLLFWSVVACIVTAILQMTVGLLPYTWSVIVCLASSVVAIGFLLVAIFLIQKNVNEWIRSAEKLKVGIKPEESKPEDPAQHKHYRKKVDKWESRDNSDSDNEINTKESDDEGKPL